MIKYLRVSASEVTQFIVDIADYTSVTVTGTINALYPSTGTLTTEEVVTSLDHDFFVNSCDLYIKPEFFGLTEFIDGVYDITVKFTHLNGFITITNCVYIDITHKCKVASLLRSISAENELAGTEKTSTIVHLLHYALVNGSNCGCNCVELLQVFNELKDLLSEIDPQILKDCGC